MAWFQDTLFELIRRGGTQTSEEHYEARLAACKQCPYIGLVEPLPGVKAEGCTLCTCPLETKARMLTYFSPSRLQVVDSRCTLVEKTGEDRWADADALYKQTVQ